MTIYWLCAGICLVVIVVSIIIVLLSISRVKKKAAELAIEKQKLESEKSDFAFKESQLRRAQEDLKNAQILFQKEKEAKIDLSKKTEKEVAIDLFLKFLEMESVFGYMKNNLASIDSKLLGVKNYSEDLGSMKTEVKLSLDSLKAEMTALQINYSTSLSSIYNDLKVSLANIENRIERIVSSITEKEMANLARDVNQELNQLKDTVEQRLVSLASEFGSEIEERMPTTIDEDDVENAVRSALSWHNVSSLDKSDIEEAVESAVEKVFPYSLDFASGIRDAVEEAIRNSQ